ncbi:hypothetical protein GE21DRAFT_3252 [Neurospora crassa]|uniref:Uncharacterized protein n=2 Tax=Neurospora crassa TaxID=5141 RepID=Q1K5Q6_NEUCR|nr:hypothetical protein NCU01769 [Neurospora crassa OR74A]EAA27956.1 hypothetical protein NCU01769 [Neurospora crassa OR74A]KHE83589.1 hypothetical protein GE21DRAFT_3252 [Neurospora crassa]CAB91225.1 hypothetical protein [Neurospora crassa]|eukprot:XP_957192.1 hypothetical protein NCU01769 [Neurospora crassa OR74A]
MGVSRFYRVALFGASVHALAFPGPQATDRVIIPSDAQTPRPTLPPTLHHELFKRQVSGSASGSGSYGDTIFVAPDNTCGYVSGLPGAAFTCVDPANYCVFIPSSGTIPGAAGCCNPKLCGFRVACMDYSEVLVQSKCDDGCMADTYTAKCTGTDNPYCGTIVFPGGITDYFCGTLSGSRIQSAKTTWDGETDGRTFLTWTNTGSSSTIAVPTMESSSTDHASLTASSSSSGTVGVGGSSTDPANPNQPEPKKEQGGTNIGAIVGGAVGGLAVIGLVILGIVWLVRRNKNRNNNNNNTPDTLATSSAAAGAPGGGGGGGGGHAGLTNSPPPPAPSPGNLDPALNNNSHNSYYYAGGQPDPTKIPAMAQHYPAPASSPPLADYSDMNNGGQHPQWNHNPNGSPTSGYIPPSSPSSTLVSGGGYQPSSGGGHPHHLSMSGQSFTGAPMGGQGQGPIYGPGGQPIYEAASNAVGEPQELNANHRGQMHELQ